MTDLSIKNLTKIDFKKSSYKKGLNNPLCLRNLTGFYYCKSYNFWMIWVLKNFKAKFVENRLQKFYCKKTVKNLLKNSVMITEWQMNVPLCQIACKSRSVDWISCHCLKFKNQQISNATFSCCYRRSFVVWSNFATNNVCCHQCLWHSHPTNFEIN